ncbi:hypothetical protein BH11ARM2_BH11ARM2_08120 [soil metagenome]
MRQSAFTLIELLVVIAIIAILAAILFPVFAQAKQAANKASDLSNVKQMVLAHTMYWGDSDDVSVTSYSAGIPGDFTFMVQPYMKNRAIMLSPGRKISMASFGASCSANLMPGGIDNPWGEPYVWGYGYNTGHDWNDGSGMVTEVDAPANQPSTYTITINGTAYTVNYRNPFKVGKPLSAVVAPANVMLLGNTADTVVAGMGRGDIQHPKFDGPNPDACTRLRKQNWPTWNDGLNVGFVDGHAKLQKLDLNTASWSMSAGQGRRTGSPDVRTLPKVFTDPCLYFSDYDGSSNVGGCKTGDAASSS